MAQAEAIIRQTALKVGGNSNRDTQVLIELARDPLHPVKAAVRDLCYPMGGGVKDALEAGKEIIMNPRHAANREAILALGLAAGNQDQPEASNLMKALIREIEQLSSSYRGIYGDLVLESRFPIGGGIPGMLDFIQNYVFIEAEDDFVARQHAIRAIKEAAGGEEAGNQQALEALIHLAESGEFNTVNAKLAELRLKELIREGNTRVMAAVALSQVLQKRLKTSKSEILVWKIARNIRNRAGKLIRH